MSNSCSAIVVSGTVGTNSNPQKPAPLANRNTLIQSFSLKFTTASLILMAKCHCKPLTLQRIQLFSPKYHFTKRCTSTLENGRQSPNKTTTSEPVYGRVVSSMSFISLSAPHPPRLPPQKKPDPTWLWPARWSCPRETVGPPCHFSPTASCCRPPAPSPPCHTQESTASRRKRQLPAPGKLLPL